MIADAMEVVVRRVEGPLTISQPIGLDPPGLIFLDSRNLLTTFGLL
jgi:hypothetical protein